ncbi:hypothetical protein DRQ50_10175 [bacterium]|nr:MAG: hypothetical protein DRQ50_10175 [bacterium]
MYRHSLRLLVATVVLVSVVTPVTAETWVRAAGGLSHMAMGDIGGASFNFYDEPGAEATWGDVGTGFLLDLAAGHDVNRNWGVGFHWEHQWAGSTATDQGVDGDLNLKADFFLARLYWRPVHGGNWNLGLVSGLGYFFAGGSGKVTRGTVNYGESDLWGNSWSFDLALIGGWRLTDHAELQVQVGGRYAVIDKFEIGKRVVHREDGTQAELDYSGWQIKAGVRWSLGDSDPEAYSGL